MDKKEVLAKITQEEIMQHYFPYKINNPISYLNPFRKKGDEDVIAGCKFYYFGEKYLFRDFSHPDLSGDCFKVCSMANGDCSFDESIRIISKDFNLDWKIQSFKELKEFAKKKAKVQIEKSVLKERYLGNKFTLEIHSCPLQPKHYLYWKKLGVPCRMLKEYNVLGLEKIVFKSSSYNSTRSYDGSVAFCYDEGDSGKTAYIPHSPKGYRFFKTVSGSHVMGVEEVKNNLLGNIADRIIVTKSKKDMLVLNSLGFFSISLQSELPNITERVKKEIELLSVDPPLIIYDGDEPGRKLSALLSKNTGWPYLVLKQYDDPGTYASLNYRDILYKEIAASLVIKDFRYG